MAQPQIVLHVLPPSHPCLTAKAALRRKGLEFETVNLQIGTHNEEMAKLYGEGNTTVPGMLVDDEPVHGSRAITAKLEEIAPEPSLFPSDAVREAERWGDEELQDLGRRLPWGALHFRPQSMGILMGAGQLDPAGTDYAIKGVRAGWKYHGLSAVRLAEDLEGLPAKLDHVDALIAEGTIGDADAPNAADLQIGATLKVLHSVADLRPLLEGRPCSALAQRLFTHEGGTIPAGAYPEGWVPAAAA